VIGSAPFNRAYVFFRLIDHAEKYVTQRRTLLLALKLMSSQLVLILKLLKKLAVKTLAIQVIIGMAKVFLSNLFEEGICHIFLPT